MKKKVWSFVIPGIVIIVIAIVLFSWGSLQDFWKSDAPTIEVELQDEAKTEDEPKEPVIMDRFLDLYAQNNDLVGWIHVPGTVIDYPVVYCADNAFYLKHDFNKEPSKDGVPFLDMRADLLVNNQSLSLYGHYWNNGTMFSALHNYKKLEFYQNNPLFEFDSLYEEGTFKIFSVYYMAGNHTDANFYNYMVSHFDDDEAFMEHVRQLQVRSIFNTTVDVKPGDQLVLMTCCTYETDNLRLVVAGRKVRPDEDPAVDTENAQRNPSPLYPKKML